MKQLLLDDASAQWAQVLARLRESVRAAAQRPPAGWCAWGSWSAPEPGAPYARGRSGPYHCQRLTDGERVLELWYALDGAPLSHELVAATCGGLATAQGVEPDVVLRFVYEGRVG